MLRHICFGVFTTRCMKHCSHFVSPSFFWHLPDEPVFSCRVFYWIWYHWGTFEEHEVLSFDGLRKMLDKNILFPYLNVYNRWKYHKCICQIFYTFNKNISKPLMTNYSIILKPMNWLSHHELQDALRIAYHGFFFLVLIKGIRKWCESRNSHRRCSTKKVVLKSFAMFTRKHLCWILFLIKLQAFRPTTLLKWTPTQTFSCKYCKTFKGTCFEKYLWTAASVSQRFSWVTSEAESFYADLLQAGCGCFCFTLSDGCKIWEFNP